MSELRNPSLFILHGRGRPGKIKVRCNGELFRALPLAVGRRQAAAMDAAVRGDLAEVGEVDGATLAAIRLAAEQAQVDAVAIFQGLDYDGSPAWRLVSAWIEMTDLLAVPAGQSDAAT